MKENRWIVILGVVLIGFLASFSKDRHRQTKNNIENYIQSGTWRITKFIDSGTDETAHFTGYTFSFNSGGLLRATNGSNTYDGTWSITDSNSKDDTQDDLDFNINFSAPADFEDLSDDWDFLSHYENRIELRDISGGNGGVDYLTFQKN